MTPTAFLVSPRTRLRALALPALLAAVGVLAGCPASLPTVRSRTDAITEYGAAVRWSEFDRALTFVDPSGTGASALTDLERERFKQLQVTGYDVKAQRTLPDGSIEQDVEVRVVNRNTQIERTVMDHQHWRWDDGAKHFWLVSGMPDFGGGQP